PSSIFDVVSTPGLHSFPTRRSSDLQEVLRFHALERRGNFAPAPLPRQRQGPSRVPAPADREHRRIQQCLHQEVAHGLAVEIAKEDRKSTRLNSSHGSISYAVFCLKK